MTDSRLQNYSRSEWAEMLLAVTQNWRRRDLSLHLGSSKTSMDSFNINLEDLEVIRHNFGTIGSAAHIYYQAVDYFIRSKVEPFQAMLNTWMQGAKAEVDAQKVPFNEVIIWSQDTGDNLARAKMAKEVHSLCAFLAPFSCASWKALLNVLEQDLGYSGYMAFCGEKKGISLTEYGSYAEGFLNRTRETYRGLVGPWLDTVTGLSLNEASRFDAIYLLGLRYMDHLFPQGFTIEKIMEFFHRWGMNLVENPALHIHSEGTSGRQSYCIPVDIPKEVHVITGPLRGWLDMESFFHELGHALGFIYTDPTIPPEEKDFFQSEALSEAFAFLFQRMCMSKRFLEGVLGLSPGDAQTVSRAHALKMLTLIRRYGAKLVIEVENFRLGQLKEGQPLYSEIMERETGFYYDPETYLFDLMPDFYSLDYFQAFIGARSIWKYLKGTLGDDWFLNPETGDILRGWWHAGNRLDLPTFLQENLGMPWPDSITLQDEL
ncbi:MAG: hypothetical protein GWP10_03765 [Nitrospiraceae bacterium]|nr:hypothetical protein [Nitrospiraceae bacterium]